jgi:hypothetical protein
MPNTHLAKLGDIPWNALVEFDFHVRADFANVRGWTSKKCIFMNVFEMFSTHARELRRQRWALLKVTALHATLQQYSNMKRCVRQC